MRCFIAILTSLVLFVSSASWAQPVIAIAERNNYGDIFKPERNQYATWVRSVFQKNDSGWIAIDSLVNGSRVYENDGRKGLVLKASDLRLPDGTVPSRGYANGGLYCIVQNDMVMKDFPEPDSIFEHRDILKYAVLTNRPGPILSPLRSGSVNLPFQDRQRIATHLHVRIRDWIRKNTPDVVLDTSYYATPYMNRDDFLSYLENVDLLSCEIDSKNNRLFAVRFPKRTWPTGVLYQLCQVFSLHEVRTDITPPQLYLVLRGDGTGISFHADLRLLEHGDFDQDGKDEYLFFSSSFNNYGYFLVYDDFQRTALYEWHSH